MNRRSFLNAGLLTSLSPALLHAIESKKEERACVFIFLGGGISHIDFLNPIPEAPVEYRGVNGAVKTKSGWDIGGNFPNLAKISDKFTGVRSFKHPDGNHYTATHAVVTGHVAFNISEGGEQKEPAFGSFVAQKYNESLPNGVPTYLKTSPISHDRSGWLGSRYGGFDYNAESIKNLSLNIPEDRFRSRLGIMNIIDGDASKQVGIDRQWGELKETASKVIVGSAGKALDVNNEPEQGKKYYNIERSGFGRNLLIARRALEAGTKFVTVQYGGWDMHSAISDAMNRTSVELDNTLPLFILDLEQRGMLKNTLIVVASEFGRTPKVNRDFGRDHFPSVNSLILAGGNYGGSVLGKTDSKATVVEESPFEPKDLTFTILNHFGFEKGDALTDSMRRPRYLIEDSAKLII